MLTVGHDEFFLPLPGVEVDDDRREFGGVPGHGGDGGAGGWSQAEGPRARSLPGLQPPDLVSRQDVTNVTTQLPLGDPDVQRVHDARGDA